MAVKYRTISMVVLLAFIITLFSPTVTALAAAAPVITNISPTIIPYNSNGTTVVIEGYNFSKDAKVFLGNKEVPQDQISISSNGRTIQFVAPANDGPATVDVRVENPDGQVAFKLAAFTYQSNPQIFEARTLSDGEAIYSTVGGGQVKIIGEGFLEDAELYIGGNKVATDYQILNGGKEIRATVPPASNIVFNQGEETRGVTVELINPDGGKAVLSSTSEHRFSYKKSNPTITSIQPTKGNKGTKVTIEGNEFFPDPNKIDVLFGDSRGDGIKIEGNRITVNAPPGAGTVPISVKNPDGASFTMQNAFQYVLLPEIHSITPNSGKAGDTITIKGLNFKQIPNLALLFGSWTANVNIIDDTTLEVIVPALNTGTFDVKVYSKDDEQISYTVKDGFTYRTTISKPTITKITPNAASPQGGTEVTIEGSEFLNDSNGNPPKVFFGSVEASVVRVESTSKLIVTVPYYPYGTGRVNVHVVNGDGGTSDTEDKNFEFKQAIGITEVTPNRGSVEGNTPVTITGFNFPYQNNTAKVQVFIGNNEAPSAVITGSQRIEIETPKGWLDPNSPGGTSFDVTIRVTYEDGTTEQAILKNGFTYVRPESNPTIDKIYNPLTNDATGPRTGGIDVYLEGQDIREGVEIFFGPIADGNKLLIKKIEKINNGFRVVGTLPNVGIPGPYDVILVNPDGATAILRSGFTFKGTTMWISTITPDFGPTSGNTSITIFGANFNEGKEKPSVLFIDEEDPEQATVQADPDSVEVSADGSILKAKTPPFTPGKKRVVLKNSFGETTNLVYFTYHLGEYKPIITGVWAIDDDGNESDAKGPVTGGTRILIKGEQFSSGAEVLVDGQPATDVVVKNDQEIIAVTPPCLTNPGAKSVTVINRIYDPGTGEYKSYSHTLEKAFFYYSAPQITGVSPRVASTKGGNIITLTGKQFYPGLTVVLTDSKGGETKIFGENVYIESQEIVRIKIPPVRTEDYPEGQVILRLYNTDGGSATSDDLTFKKPAQQIEIHQITPKEGPVTGGTIVTIKGKDFEPDATVYFGFQPAKSVQVISPTELRVVTPPNPAGVYDVLVTNFADGSNAVKEGGFTYKEPKTSPKINYISPTVGPKEGGTKLIIVGEDFWPGAQVYIGPYLATDVKWHSNQMLTAVTPRPEDLGGQPMDVGTYDVTVINYDSSSATLKNAFTVKSPASKPTIDTVSPNTVVTTGGTIVTITGSDFRKNVEVYFGNRKATVIELREQEGVIIVKAPTNSKGTYDVTVINTDGGVAQLIDGINYVLPESNPQIESINPTKGNVAGGTEVTIIGDDFRGKVDENGREVGVEVYFGSNKATSVVVENYYTIKAITPPGQAGKVDVTVRNVDSPGSVTLPNAFEYVTSAPVIKSVLPNIGSYEGGTLVTILGNDFLDGAKVFIGEMEAANPEVDEDNGKIIIKAPSLKDFYGENKYAQYLFKPLDVKVINPDGQSAVLSKAFTYKYPDSKPKISDVVPASGSVAGGQPIEIIGEDFRAVYDDKGTKLLYPKVYIGGKEATDVVFVSSEKLTCRIPANNAGPAKVVVVNEDGGSAVWDKNFMYEEPKSEPKITSVVPKQGPEVGGTSVTITGSDFRKSDSGELPKVWFGNNPATNVTWEAYNKITAVTPEGTGTVDVIVVNPDKGQAILSKGFTYIKVTIPKVTSVDPNTGPDTGGTAIEIKGEKFAKGAEVYIGGNLATNIEVVDENTIRAVTPPGNPGWQEVRVVNPDGGWGKLDNGFQYRGKPGEPDWFTAKAKDYETIELKWSSVDFANYYEIYISNKANGTYRFLAQTKDTYYYATNLEPDTKYYFKLRAVNEVGVSAMTGYDYATTDDDAPKKKKNSADTIITAANGNTAEILVPSLAALKNEGYILDLTQQKLQKTVQKITFSAEVLNDFSWNFTVKTTDFTLSVHPLSILVPQYWNAGSSKLEDVYSSLIITDLGQQEAERALKSLPKGAKILSKVYSVGWELAEGKKVTTEHLFFKDVYLTMDYKSSDVPKGKSVDIFVYNDSTGKWERAKAIKDSYYTRLNRSLIKPERFVVVAY